MKSAAISRKTIICWTFAVVVGIGALVFFAPIVGAIAFVVLATMSAVLVGKKEGGWKGIVAFAKDILFSW